VRAALAGERSDSPPPGGSADVVIDRRGAVAVVTLARPPHNHLDAALLGRIADALEELDRDDEVRATVLAADGRSFCAGADFGVSGRPEPGPLYQAALRLFAVRKPVIAAVHGAAIGAGLGLALAADFRVAGPSARFAANFVKVGIHPGFGLTYTLAKVVGAQVATDLFLTGRRVDGREALKLGLTDRLAPDGAVTAGAVDLATELAANAPLAILATRATLRADIVARVSRHMDLECREQTALFSTADFHEGVRAVAERRAGRWQSA
jgi:enoyl-CoA hydratase/carnithine racemase